MKDVRETVTQSEYNRTLAGLIGSRICHDLISPVGAMANGLELLSLAGVPGGPEMELAVQSAANAGARLRFFRVAFGMSSDGQTMSTRELTGILHDVYCEKTKVDWQFTGDLPRVVAQAICLGLMCAEQALPQGGVMTVNGTADAVQITSAGGRLGARPAHWGWLTDGAAPGDVPAAQVQFVMLHGLLAGMDRAPVVDSREDALSLYF